MPQKIFPAQPSWTHNHSTWNLQTKMVLGHSHYAWVLTVGDHLVLSFGLGIQLLDVPCSHVTVAVIKLIMVSPPMDSFVALLLLISARKMQVLH